MTSLTSYATADELAVALPHVMAAPKSVTRVASLCFRPMLNRREFPDRLILTRDKGIPGDRWLTMPWLTLPDGRPDPQIQVSILQSRVLDLVWRNRETVVHPGDPIIADMDLSEQNLPAGTFLKAGTAVLRVSEEPNLGCVKWKVRYGAASLDWVKSRPELRLRGVLCSIEEDGEVAVGDLIEVLR